MSNLPNLKMNVGTGSISMLAPIFNYSENAVYKNGCYKTNFESREEMLEYQHLYMEVKNKITDINAARDAHKNMARYEHDIKSIYVPIACSFVSKYGELVLPDVCFSLRSCESGLGMELIPWDAYETKWANYSASM